MREVDKAYAAALIDGEGSILLSRVHKKDKFKAPCVSVATTSYELALHMKELFGGSISSKKVYEKHHKPSYQWAVWYNKALYVMEVVFPYLKEKSKLDRVEHILLNYKAVTRRNGKYTSEELAEKFEFEASFY